MWFAVIVAGLATPMVFLYAIAAWKRYVVRQRVRIGNRWVSRGGSPVAFWLLAAFNILLFAMSFAALGRFWMAFLSLRIALL